MLNSPLKILFSLLTILCLVMIIHLGTILLIPVMTHNSIWHKVSAISNENELLPIIDDDAPLLWPLQSKALYYAFCRYNLKNNLIISSFPLHRRTWSISVYNRSGENFYTVDGYDLKRNHVSLLIHLNKKLPKIEQDILPVKAPEAEGFIVLRAPKESKALNQVFQSLIRTSECREVEQEKINDDPAPKKQKKK